MFVAMEPSFRTAKHAKIQYFHIEQAHKKILPFVTQFQPALKGLKNIHNVPLGKWHLIQNQPNLREIHLVV